MDVVETDICTSAELAIIKEFATTGRPVKQLCYPLKCMCTCNGLNPFCPGQFNCVVDISYIIRFINSSEVPYTELMNLFAALLANCRYRDFLAALRGITSRLRIRAAQYVVGTPGTLKKPPPYFVCGLLNHGVLVERRESDFKSKTSVVDDGQLQELIYKRWLNNDPINLACLPAVVRAVRQVLSANNIPEELVFFVLSFCSAVDLQPCTLR